MLLKLSQDFDIRKLSRKQRINMNAALRRFHKICALTNQIYSIEAIVKLASFCFPPCSLRLVLSFLPGPLLK